MQRAVIALTEKGVAFERIDIDLANKPDWFLKISPLGKVPVLVIAAGKSEVALFESNVILRIHRGDPRRTSCIRRIRWCAPSTAPGWSSARPS